MIIRPTNKFKGRRYPNGPHQGELIEMVVIKYPDYIHWLSQKTQVPGFQWLYDTNGDMVCIHNLYYFLQWDTVYSHDC